MSGHRSFVPESSAKAPSPEMDLFLVHLENTTWWPEWEMYRGAKRKVLRREKLEKLVFSLYRTENVLLPNSLFIQMSGMYSTACPSDQWELDIC